MNNFEQVRSIIIESARASKLPDSNHQSTDKNESYYFARGYLRAAIDFSLITESERQALQQELLASFNLFIVAG